MYISNWDDFQKAAEDIYISSPDTTRYVHTFHGTVGELVLKVTNDQTIVKYKTNQATDLKKFISLNTNLMSQMQNKSMDVDEPEPAAASPITAANTATTTTTTVANTNSPQIPQVSSATSKPSNKKKSSKKRKGGK